MDVALTIGGSDPSGGAGIQADLKTFARFGVYGCSAISLLTVQNTRGIERVENISAELVSEQIIAVLDDFDVGAIKTGALGDHTVVDAVVRALEGRIVCPLVVDPVFEASDGSCLLQAPTKQANMAPLLGMTALLTPNLDEASALLGRSIDGPEDMATAAAEISALGPAAVLLTGGHLDGERLVDVLFDGERLYRFEGTRIESRHTHGTGCTLSAAITAQLALGRAMPDACRDAIAYVRSAIATAPGLGKGQGPLNHAADQ
jgi:hydroxymethylpyrimidine/phosphomethylpyrimidine kinase